MQQHHELCQRLVAIAQQAESEMEELKAEAQTFATERDEARAELVALRAAHESELKKCAIVQAGVMLTSWVGLGGELMGDWTLPQAPALKEVFDQHIRAVVQATAAASRAA